MITPIQILYFFTGVTLNKFYHVSGKNLALLELKIIVALILTAFRVKSLQNPEDLELAFEVVLTSKTGLHLQFTPRYWLSTLTWHRAAAIWTSVRRNWSCVVCPLSLIARLRDRSLSGERIITNKTYLKH